MAHIHTKIERYFEKSTAWIYQWKWLALTVMIILSFGLAKEVPNIRIDTRDESFFHEDDPALIAYNDFRDRFGQDDLFIIALKPEKTMTPDFFITLHQMFHELKDSVPYLDEIEALVNGRIVKATGDTLRVEKLMVTPPETLLEIEQLMAEIDRYPMFDQLLISKDRLLTTILIRAQSILDHTEEDVLEGFGETAPPSNPSHYRYLSNAQYVEMATAIDGVMQKYDNRGIDFYTSGTPVFVAEIQKAIEKDLGLMIPLSLLMIILFLTLLFRRISGVIYPLIVVLLSLFSCLGIMALADIAITNVIQILPIFLIVVGIGDSVHILTLFYRHLDNGKSKKEAIVQAVGTAGLPVLMTSVTTALGLLSFGWADIAAIAELGFIAPAGVMLAMLYTVILLPALIAILPVRERAGYVDKKDTIVDRLFNTITRLSTGHPWTVAVLSATILLVAGFCALSVRLSHNAMTWFPEKAPVRIATEMLNHVNGGTITLEVLIDTGRKNGMLEPDFLNRLDEAVGSIPAIREGIISAGKSWAVTDIIKEIHRALNEEQKAFYKLPDSKELIAQELLLFESSGSDDLEDFVDSTYQTARLSILAPFNDSVLYVDYVKQITNYLSRLFPDDKITLTGHMSLFVKITKNFIISLLKSYIFALLVITLLMVIMIGRLRIGLMSMVANVGPIICVFGIMGVAGIPLDMATILIGSIVLGLVVDDTIHFLHHFRTAFEKTGCLATAVNITLHTTGRALLITSLVLCGGFFIYTTSYLVNNARFGLLVGCAVIFALIADFLLVPALLSIVYRKQTQVKTKFI